MALRTAESSSTGTTLLPRRRRSKKGFVWVRQSGSEPRLTMLGVSSALPADTDDSLGDGNWHLRYVALVDDTQATIKKADSFLHSFIDPSASHDSVYQAEPVVLATAIETSGIPVRFRKSAFRSTQSSAASASGAPVSAPVDIDDDITDDTQLRSILEKSIERRQRTSALVDGLDEFEELLARSEEITGVKTPAAVQSARDPADELPLLTEVADTASTDTPVSAPAPAPAPVDVGRRPLFKDTEPVHDVPLEGPDEDAMRRMERLIRRREATQNLRQIRRGYVLSFLQGIPLGAVIGLGAVLVLNIPAEPEQLFRIVAAGTCAVPLTLFAIRVIRNWNRSSYWRNVLSSSVATR